MIHPEIHRPVKVGVIGAGNVGATFAYSLVITGLTSEIVLVDANRSKAEGEAMDLNHTAPLARPVRVIAGDYADLAGAVVTVVTAGSAQRPGETRLDLAARNMEIFKKIIPQIVQHNPTGIILIATNPVDVLSYGAWKVSGLPRGMVFGSGTILDTARFRYLLSHHYGVDPRSVHAFIIGEHGDSEVPVWSLANIAGMNVQTYCRQNSLDCDDDIRESIFAQTRDAAYQIIERKGSTYYAIGLGLERIVEAIVRDQESVLSVSSLIEDYYGINDVFLSLPSIVDRGGIERTIRLELDSVEQEGLKKSAAVLRSTLKSLGF